MDVSDWYVEAVVHAVIPADGPKEALEAMCDLIRTGIGEEPPNDGERPYRAAIAASRFYAEDKPEDVYEAHNEAWLARRRGFKT